MTSRRPLSLSLTFLALALAPTTFAQTTLAQPNLAVRAAPVLPTLTMSDSLRALELIGEPRSPYVVFAGLERVSVPLTMETTLLVPPDVVLSIGTLDGQGHAYVPVDNYGSAPAGSEVYAQALLWSPTGPMCLAPDRATDVATITLHGHQTPPPQIPFGPGETLHLIPVAGAPPAHAEIGVQTGVPPRYFVDLEVEAPSSGDRLQIDSIAHRGSFTRVVATLVRPYPGQPTPDRVRPLRERALLGVWIGTVEVDLRIFIEPQPSSIGTAPPGR